MKNPKTISTGNFVRNGANFYFLISDVTGTTVKLTEYNTSGPTGKTRVFSLELFTSLIKLKNFEFVNYFKSIRTNQYMERRDTAAARGLGLERFLIQQPIYVLDKMRKRRF